jgi:protein SCO1/2
MHRRTLLCSTVAASLAIAPAAIAATSPIRGRRPPAGIGGPIDLVDHQGQPFTLDRVRGRPALLFFGFTRCSATCPVAMLTARELLARAPAGQAPTILFVTLDPLADGPPQLAEFVRRIDRRIIGLTGTPAQIERAIEAYGVGVRPAAVGVDHSSVWYLLDAGGRVRLVFPHNAPAREIAFGMASLEVVAAAREVRR